MPRRAARRVHAQTATPDGVPVVLYADTWYTHILVAHTEIGPHLDAVLAAVSMPEHREPDRQARREQFYKRHVGPSRWFVAVVSFEQEPARIVTAYGYGHGQAPEGWTG
jgi:hypothetical protein